MFFAPGQGIVNQSQHLRGDKNMNKISNDILKAVAPCSMFCSTCTGCKYGDISLHAKELLRLLDGHKEFLEKNLKKEYRHKLDEFIVFQNNIII